MIHGNDFEHRLGQGLKRWAGAGKPTMDLEQFVKEQLGQAPAPPNPATERRAPARRRWPIGAAAAAALLLGFWLSFPAWAGAAARLPLIGPVVTEVIMKDAGLNWAYEQGLMQETVAEVTEGDITVRILGAVADRARTTVIYQIIGWQEPEQSAQPIPVGRFTRLSHQVTLPPSISISEIDGQGVGSWGNQARMTPVGLVGTVTAMPLEADSAPVQVTVRVNGKEVQLHFDLTRTDGGSEETLLAQSQTIGDITITLHMVLHSPAETIVRLTTRKPPFSGSYSWGEAEGPAYLEQHGDRHLQMNAFGTWHHPEELTEIAVFPASTGPVKLVIPAQVTGRPADLLWRLEPGFQQEMYGTTITLTGWGRDGDQVSFRWEFPNTGALKGFTDFEVVDTEGVAHPLQIASSGWSSTTGGPEKVSVEGHLPPHVTPAAIRAKEIGLLIQGPWIFDLPS